MNQIITTFANISSLQPFSPESLDFFQNAQNEIMVAIAVAYVQSLLGYNKYNLYEAYVLYGQPYSLTGIPDHYNFSIGDSYVLFGNSIYKLNSTALTDISTNTLSNLGFSFMDFYPPTLDPTKFSDASTHNVHQIRTLQYTTTSALFPYTNLVYPTIIPTQISNDIPSISGWINDYILNSHWNGTSTLRFKKDSFGQVLMNGYISCSGTPSTPSVMTMSTGYIPAQAKTFTVTSHRSGFQPDTIIMNPDGSVNVVDFATYSTTHNIYFDKITYYTN